jgi:hypothetical protein
MDSSKSDQTPEIKFTTGVKSSAGATKYEYISVNALRSLALHLHDGTDGTGGAARYGKDNWKKGLNDTAFLVDRLNHLIDHAIELSNLLDAHGPAIMHNCSIPVDKHIRGIGCNWMFVQHAIDLWNNEAILRKEKYDKEVKEQEQKTNNVNND